MSKIIITECKIVEKPGKTTFWACKDSVGNAMTSWKKEEADIIMANLNKPLEVTLKQQGNFINIRGVENPNPAAPSQLGGDVPVENIDGRVARIPVENGKCLMSELDISIISQVCIKTAGVIVGGMMANGSDLAEDAIKEVTLRCADAYNSAVLFFEQNG